MKIAFIVPRFLPSLGGIEMHVAELATRIRAAGHHVVVATQVNDTQRPTRASLGGIQLVRFPGAFAIRGQDILSPGLVRYAATADADIVHVQNYHTPTAILALAASSATTVFTPHYLGPRSGAVERALHSGYRLAASPGIRRAAVLIHVSEAEAADFDRDFGGTPATRTVVIPNGVDLDAVAAATPARKEHRRIVMACRLEAYKQPTKLVEALRYLPADVEIVIAGSGPEEAHLQMLAQRLRIADRVKLVGQVDKDALFGLLRSADLVVSLSTSECFGLTIAEALAAGAPVLATDLDAHLEVARRAGYSRDHFVRVDIDAGTLAERIESALEQPQDHPWHIDSWDDVARQTLALYESLLVQASPSATRR